MASTNYPGSLDAYPVPNNGDTISVADHWLGPAVIGIETELGTDPAGTFTDVKSRLDDADKNVITDIDMWVVGTSMTGLGGISILTNWSRATSLALTPYKGSGLTEASNNFSFTSTGYWQIYVQVYVYSITNVSDHYIKLLACTDGSTYSERDLFFAGATALSTIGFNGSTVLKITDTTNQKFNLQYTASAGNYSISGGTTRFDTGLIAKKIGEI